MLGIYNDWTVGSRDALAGLLDLDLAPDTYRALFRGVAERFLGER